MSSTHDHGVLRPAHKARNMPKHFFITCQVAFHLVSVQASLLLFVTRTEAALIYDSDEKTALCDEPNVSDVVSAWRQCGTKYGLYTDPFPKT